MASFRTALLSLAILAAFTVTARSQAPQSETAAPASAEVLVGGRRILIPSPDGYVRCDGIDPIWDKAIASMLPASNRLLASFGTPEAKTNIAAGTGTDFSKNFNVQLTRSFENQEIGESSFAQIRAELKTGLEKFAKNIDKEFKKVIASGNRKFKEDLGADAGISISDTVFLGFFDESDTSLGFSMAMKAGAASDAGADQARMISAAMMVPVNGRVLNLYYAAPYASQQDQLQAQQAVSAWRDLIVAANPRLAGPNMGFDWTKVIRGGIIGGAIGLVYGLIAWVIRRSKRKANPVA